MQFKMCAVRHNTSVCVYDGARIYVKSNTSLFKLNRINNTHNEKEEELDEVEENGAEEERTYI